jgi:hypothetical protein
VLLEGSRLGVAWPSNLQGSVAEIGIDIRDDFSDMRASANSRVVLRALEEVKVQSDGDGVLTPSMQWHSHHHHGDVAQLPVTGQLYLPSGEGVAHT